MSRRPWWNLSPCGTEAACKRHYRKGEKPCQACLDASLVAQRARRARRAALAEPRPRSRDAAGRFTTAEATRRPA